jgi:hypothetical protein
VSAVGQGAIAALPVQEICSRAAPKLPCPDEQRIALVRFPGAMQHVSDASQNRDLDPGLAPHHFMLRRIRGAQIEE